MYLHQNSMLMKKIIAILIIYILLPVSIFILPKAHMFLMLFLLSIKGLFVSIYSILNKREISFTQDLCMLLFIAVILFLTLFVPEIIYFFEWIRSYTVKIRESANISTSLIVIIITGTFIGNLLYSMSRNKKPNGLIISLILLCMSLFL